MNIFDLAARITADTSDFDSKVSNLASSGIKKFAALTTAATAAVGAFTGSAVKTGAEFDKSMSQVQATMLKSNEEMENSVGSVSTAYGDFEGNLRDFALFLGDNTAFSAKQAADALNYMALAGYDTQESMDMLPNVLSLAAAGNFDLARASDMVTDSQTAFGISAERTEQMVDEMAKTASISNTSVEQLGDAFLTVGGLAKELNGGMVELADGTQQPVDGLQELEIALGAMANAGVKGSEAGTHMRNMLLKLASPTKEGMEAFEKLGVTVFDTEGNMKSLKDIFGDLNGAMSNLTQEEKLQAISDIFNTRDTASAEALLAAIGQDWDEIGEGILNAEGAASDMAKIQLDNLAGDITLAKSALDTLKIGISDELSPILRNFVQIGTKYIQKLTKWIGDGGLAKVIEKVRNGWNRLTEALSPIGEKISELFGILTEGGYATDILSSAFDVFVNVISKVSEGIAWIIDKINKFISWMKEGGPEVDAFKAIVLGLATAIGTLIAIFEGMKIVDTVSKSVQALGAVFDVLAANPIMIVIAAITALIAALVYLYNNNEEFREKVQAIWEGIKEFFSVAAEVITTIWEGVVEFFTDVWERIKEVWDTVSPYLQAVWEVITGIFSTAWENIKIVWDAVSPYFQLVWDTISGIFSVVQKVLSGDFSGAWDEIKKIVDGWEDYFQGIWDAIKEIFEPVINWFEEHFGGAWEAIKTIWDDVVSYYRNIWESIKEIFSVVESVLSGDWQGAWDGIQSIVSLWEGWFSDVWQDIQDVFAPVAEWFKGIFEDAWEFIKSPFESVSSFFSDVWEEIKSAFSIDEAFNWGADLLANFTNGIASMWTSFVDTLSSAAQTVANFLGFSEPEEGPLSNFHTFAPDMMELFAKGIRDNEDVVTDQIAKSFDFEDKIGKISGNYNISSTNRGANQAEPVVINVYATERQDEEEIARQVQRVFVQWENQRKAAYA